MYNIILIIDIIYNVCVCVWSSTNWQRSRKARFFQNFVRSIVRCCTVLHIKWLHCDRWIWKDLVNSFFINSNWRVLLKICMVHFSWFGKEAALAHKMLYNSRSCNCDRSAHALCFWFICHTSHIGTCQPYSPRLCMKHSQLLLLLLLLLLLCSACCIMSTNLRLVN